jgi:hypothetical protein
MRMESYSSENIIAPDRNDLPLLEAILIVYGGIHGDTASEWLKLTEKTPVSDLPICDLTTICGAHPDYLAKNLSQTHTGKCAIHGVA